MVKILLVDDDEYVRDYIKAYLVDWEHDVTDTRDGNSALVIANADPPDLILMDINMPGMTGYEAMSKLRDNPISKDVPVIALTANIAAEDRDQAYEMGCKAYVAKPIVDIELLKEAVQRALH